MLEDLEVLNGSMTPEFKPGIYEYNVVVDENVMSLILDYQTLNDASVTIYGNDYLTSGENHVLIELYDGQVKTYTLTVMKEESSFVSLFDNEYEKVEVGNFGVWKDYLTPGISVLCFLTIVILFCVIFRKN